MHGIDEFRYYDFGETRCQFKKTGNAPSNYVDIVIPTGATMYALNIANTFGGASVAYVDVAGNAVVQALYCT